MKMNRLFRIKIILLILICLSINSLFAQGFYDTEQKKEMLQSGIKCIREHEDGRLSLVTYIDSAKRIIRTVCPVPRDMLPDAPLYDSSRAIINERFYYFNCDGLLDSTFSTVNLYHYSSDHNPNMFSDSDTTLVVYHYPWLDSIPVSCFVYYIDNKERNLKNAWYFGYDLQHRLILKIGDKGNFQVFYLYNEKEQIVSEFVKGVEIKYTYTGDGKMESRITGTIITTYEYDQNLLVKKTILKDGEKKIYTYEYEK